MYAKYCYAINADMRIINDFIYNGKNVSVFVPTQKRTKTDENVSPCISTFILRVFNQ